MDNHNWSKRTMVSLYFVIIGIFTYLTPYSLIGKYTLSKNDNLIEQMNNN